VTTSLSLVDAHAGYGSVEVLHGVTMDFPSGSVVALMGRNGAGKSTVLRCLAGLIPLWSGALRWDGREVTHRSAYQRSTAGLTLVPDEHGLFPGLTVGENLDLFARDQSPEPALGVFPELEDLMDRRAGTLSGGEQQMLALSRALVRPGHVVLLDEVSRGLSPAVTARCYGALRRLAAPDRVLVIVEQYLGEVLRLADVVYVLTRGEITFAGEPAELRAEAEGPGHHATGQGEYGTVGTT